MSFVIDNSVAITWCFEAEQTVETMALLDRVNELGAIAPEIWPLEAINVLMSAQRRRRITKENRQELTKFLGNLPIAIDIGTHELAWTEIAGLAERHQLTPYDAAYLELALRRNLPFATLDEDLRRAAKKEKVELWGK